MSVKLTRPSTRPIGGIRKAVTDHVTRAPQAAPTTTATARSTTLPRTKNVLTSLSMGRALLLHGKGERRSRAVEESSAHLPHRLPLLSKRARAFGPVLALGDLLIEVRRVRHE